jgi:hypothetical protein
VHLSAAITAMRRVSEHRSIRGLSQSDLHARVDIQAAVDLGWDAPPNGSGQEYEHPLVQEQTAISFLTGIVLYIDVISCATLGISPRLQKLHQELLGPSSGRIQLENIIGCENWVIVLIGKISRLHLLNAANCHEDTIFDVCSMNVSINENLKSGIDRGSHFVGQLKRSDDYEFSHAACIRIITQLYALAASIYLQILAIGVRDDMAEVRAHVASIIAIARLVMHMDMVRNLMWPLYIAGSVAIGSERDFFRTSFTNSRDSFCFSTATYPRILAKLEDIWTNSDESGVHRGAIFASDLMSSTLLLL